LGAARAPETNETDVSSRVQDLLELAQMLDQGKITQHEYDVVKTELLEAPAEEWAMAGAPMEVEALPVEADPIPAGIPAYSNGGRSHHDETADAEPADIGDGASESETKTDPDWLVFARQIPPLYWASIGAALLSIFFAGSFTPIAWVTGIVAAVALVRVKDQNMRWMAWTGLAVGVIFSMIGIVTSGSAGSVDAAPLANTSAGPEDPAEIPVGSLGVEFSNLEEGWNALPDPPFILRGITTTPEAGVLDSFMYRFDEAALLAGAYNPSDGYIYALMAKTGVNHEARSNMYVHLCYLLYPGTQECFDTYIAESGLYNRTAEEKDESDHAASWQFEGNEWRVEIANDIETIRVLGPQQTG